MTSTAAWCFGAVLASTLLCTIASQSGYLLTAPKAFNAGGEACIYLKLIHVDSEGSVTVRITAVPGGNVTREKTVAIPATGGSIRFNVPSTYTGQANLTVEGQFGDYSFSATQPINIRQKYNYIFVETDKPTYKPGQSVQSRALAVNSNLKPLSDDTVGDIWIETPSGVRVAQWKNVSFAPGIVQHQMDLTDDPPLGYWVIRVTISPNLSGARSFNVQKYVLPKFEVIITPPPYLLGIEKIAKYVICANYTYGKTVNGQIRIQAQYTQYYWLKEKLPTLVTEDKIKGCYNYVLNIDDLALNSSTDNLNYRGIEVTAQVTEDGTGVTRSASNTIYRIYDPLQISFNIPNYGLQNFRPGLPFKGLITVTNPDSTPAPKEPIRICVRVKKEQWNFKEDDSQQFRACKNFVTNEQGEVHYTISPQPQDVVQLQIVAVAVRYRKQCNQRRSQQQGQLQVPESTYVLYSWFSPSGSQIAIAPHFQEVPCNEPLSVEFKYTVRDRQTIRFYYMVISRGAIVLHGEKIHTFHANGKSDDCDSCTIDTNSFKKLCSKDNMTRWENVVELPPYVGTVSFNITPTYAMSPQAKLVVYYIRDDHEVVADWAVIKVKQCLENAVTFGFSEKQQYPGTNATVILTASPNSMCGIGVVDKSVYLLASNNRIQKSQLFNIINTADVGPYSYPQQQTPSDEYCDKKYDSSAICDDTLIASNYADTILAFQYAGILVMSDLTVEDRPCMLAGFSGSGPCYMPAVSVPGALGGGGGFSTAEAADVALPQKQAASAIRGPQNQQQVVEIRNYFPETWLWYLTPVGSSGKVIEKKTLPDTITEWVGNAICISKKAGLGVSDTAGITTFQPFFVSSTFPYSVIRGESVPIIITVFNYLQKCLPITLRLENSPDFELVNGSNSVALCVCGGESVTYSYMVTPRSLGQVNATVYAFSNGNNTESVCSNDIDNTRESDAATWQLLVEPEGFPQVLTFNSFFCTTNNGTYEAELQLLLPSDVVNGSARAYITATGDLLGNALNNIGSFLPIPTGCGEQTLVTFVPQMFILKYLNATGRLTPTINDNIISHLQTGYLRELNFRRGDGSYSNFGTRDESASIWLTAAVVRAYGQLRNYIAVDQTDLANTVAWITSRQQPNGCFPPIGTVPYSALSDTNGGGSTPAPLTAYILIALFEPGFGNAALWSNGSNCLEANTSPSQYALALYAYAATLAGSDSASTYLQRLEAVATQQGDMRYWQGNENTSSSVRLETAAYVCLAYLKRPNVNIDQVTPIVRYIAKNMNPYGGFFSTQDTMIAIQCIAEFSVYTNVGTLNLNVAVTGDNFNHAYQINRDNQLLVQSQTLRTLPNLLDVRAVGTGCAFVQAVLLYNINLPPENQTGFHLNASAARGYGGDCKRVSLNLCASFVGNQPSNMVLIDIKLLTGFQVDTDSLDALQNSLSILKKYEVTSDSRVILYFSQLTSTKVCFNVIMTEVYPVNFLQPAIVKIYDYYALQKTVSITYTVGQDCTINQPGTPTVGGETATVNTGSSETATVNTGSSETATVNSGSGETTTVNSGSDETTTDNSGSG